ncbi:DNA adenine methylase [Helicobacter cetorum]|uniref:DNA adenine methylase n=1 Tax=Helicobacter cetorum TaxID=138563 RepID=UPI002F2B416A
MPLIAPKTLKNNVCYNLDTNILIEKIECDLLYLDPPYNSRQYSSAYHLLENIARFEKQTPQGVAKKIPLEHLKSEYCTKNAPLVFKDLISKARAKYILLSYNNMGDKGNSRSNAKISDEIILSILKQKGKVEIFETPYKYFSTGKSKITNHKERLFLCKVQ